MSLHERTQFALIVRENRMNYNVTMEVPYRNTLHFVVERELEVDIIITFSNCEFVLITELLFVDWRNQKQEWFE